MADARTSHRTPHPTSARLRDAHVRARRAGSRLTVFSRHPEHLGPERGRRSTEPFDLLTIDP